MRRRIVFEDDDRIQVLSAPEPDDPEVVELIGRMALNVSARREAREALGLSQAEVAEALGKALRTVGRWETELSIKATELGRLARFYVAVRSNPGLLKRPKALGHRPLVAVAL